MREPSEPRSGCRLGGRALAAWALLALLALLVCAAAGCAAPSTAARRATPTGTNAPPSATPSATPSAQERLLTALAAQAAGSLAAQIQARESADDGTVTVTATLDTAVPSTAEDAAAAQARVRIICFRVQQALWTSGLGPREVLVSVMGPVISDYGDTDLALYGVADLRAATAKALAWASLDPASAWGAYDGEWLRTGYRPSQAWGLSTPTAQP